VLSKQEVTPVTAGRPLHPRRAAGPLDTTSAGPGGRTSPEIWPTSKATPSRTCELAQAGPAQGRCGHRGRPGPTAGQDTGLTRTPLGYSFNEAGGMYYCTELLRIRTCGASEVRLLAAQAEDPKSGR
jgi:hypothetical protein